MPPATQNPIKKIMPVIATFFVVIGIAAIVYSNESREVPIASESPVETPTGHISMTVLAGPHAVKIIQETPVAERIIDCLLPAGTASVTGISPQGIEIVSTTGSRARMGYDCALKEEALAPGMPNPSGVKTAHVADPRADGASVVAFTQAGRTEEVTLRKSSRPYRDPQIVGWMDENQVAVVAFRGAQRVVLTIEPSGRVVELGELSEYASVFRVSPGAFWYVVTTPGPGLESEPMGPSEIHRVSTAGEDRVVVTEPNVGIDELHVEPSIRNASSSLVYGTSGHLQWLLHSGEVRDVVANAFLGWTDAGMPFVNKGGSLFILSPDGESVDTKQFVNDATVVWRVGI